MLKNRVSKISAVVAIVATMGLVVAGSADAATATNVTIKHGSGGFFGYVKSNKKGCEVSRVVLLYKQKGGSPRPSHDKYVGQSYTVKNGGKYMWSTGDTGSSKGKFYAYAPKITGCKAGKSRTI